LMNTFWGSTQANLLTITFTGSQGATWTYNPLGDVDVRDFNPATWTNAIQCRLPAGKGNAGTVNAWKNQYKRRLDMQIFELPSSFCGQTLDSITITDAGDYYFQRVFLAAITVSDTEP